MANSTDEYWSIDGTSLHQYGWSVATVGGSRYDLPTRRGDNITLAYRQGAVHRRKPADQRTINLIMWVTGMDPATGNSTADHRLRFNDSWDFLRRLVWKPRGAQVTLTRRWWLTVGGVKTLVTADAQAEVVDNMAPTMTGRHRADFTMSLLLADPYFYGPELTATINAGATVTVTNTGHDIAAFGALDVEFVGPLTAPKLTNTTPAPDVWLQYSRAVATGQSVLCSVPTFQAYNTSTNANEIGYISHGGDHYWMGLEIGANSLTLTATGSGHAVVRYRTPYV